MTAQNFPFRDYAFFQQKKKNSLKGQDYTQLEYNQSELAASDQN